MAKKTKTRCETVTVQVWDEQGGGTEIVIPAYTRPMKEMQAELTKLVDSYLFRSTISHEPMSMGDFALFALTTAAADPREM